MPPGHGVFRPSLRPDGKESGLVGAWDLGDKVDTAVYDLCPLGNTGTLVGGPVVELTMLGTAHRNYRDGKYIQLPVNANMAMANNQNAFQMWLYPILAGTSGGGLLNIYGTNVPAAGAISLCFSNNNVLLNLNNVNYTYAIGSDPFLKWHLVTLCVDHANDAFSIYLDDAILANNVAFPTYAPVNGSPRIFPNYRGGAAGDYGEAWSPCARMYNKLVTFDEHRNRYREARTACWKTSHNDISVSSADEGGVIGNYLGMPSGNPTPFQFWDAAGRWRIETDTIQGTQNCKVIANRTALGVIGIPTSIFQQNPTEAAFGTWEWLVYSPGGTAENLIILGSVNAAWNNAAQNGYIINYPPVGMTFGLYKVTGGAIVGAALMQSTGIYPSGVYYRLTLRRTTSGSFSMFINNNLMPTAVGTNPVVDTTHTTFNWMGYQGLVAVGSKLGYSCPSGDKSLLHSPIA